MGLAWHIVDVLSVVDIIIITQFTSSSSLEAPEKTGQRLFHPLHLLFCLSLVKFRP